MICTLTPVLGEPILHAQSKQVHQLRCCLSHGFNVTWGGRMSSNIIASSKGVLFSYQLPLMLDNITQGNTPTIFPRAFGSCGTSPVHAADPRHHLKTEGQFLERSEARGCLSAVASRTLGAREKAVPCLVVFNPMGERLVNHPEA